MLVVILESVSSIISPEEFFIVDGDTKEEFEICKHIKNQSKYQTPLLSIDTHRHVYDTDTDTSTQII